MRALLVVLAAAAVSLGDPAIAQAQETARPDAPPTDSLALPTAADLRELVSYAEPVALDPHSVRLESFRGDTIIGVYLVDSNLPSARHVAYGKDPHGFRYVWFSRRNPLRSSLVAMYQVDGSGAPDVLYWRQIDFEEKTARPLEFRGRAATNVTFEYSAGPPCGRARCDPEWRELPLRRIPVSDDFFQPLEALFHAAARNGERHLDQPVSSLPDSASSAPS